MKTKRIIYIILVCALALTRCKSPASSQDAEYLFHEMYSDCSMNEVLRLTLIEPMFEGDREVNFSLETISDASVIFPNDNNLRLLSFDNNQNKWTEVKNDIQYLPLDAKYIVGKNDPAIEYDYMLVGIDPRVGTKLALRVAVHGYIYKNGIETEECAGAFIDIMYAP